jgi:DNA-nicking Smr family endonuclease
VTAVDDDGGTGQLPLSGEEARLWRRATADVTRIARPNRRDAAAAQARVQAPRAFAPEAKTGPGRARPTTDPELSAGIAPGLDKRTLTQLRRGLLPPETQIDLHRCTQVEAYQRLEKFLADSQGERRRCVLVITGKGYGPSGSVGVLKTMVPRWLNEQPNRGRLLAFCHAAAIHGGEGALYVLLRKKKVQFSP